MYDVTGFRFQAWPKIPRWEKRGTEMFITEKVDGTNAAIHIGGEGDNADGQSSVFIGAQSRTRMLDPLNGIDNNGFGVWVMQNAEALIRLLGPGIHYGEWYGGKIQRGYGLQQKRLALFDTRRWHTQDTFLIESWHGGPNRRVWNQDIEESTTNELQELGVHPIPLLYAGAWHTEAVDELTEYLKESGSVVVPGYQNPEGLVIKHRNSQQLYKVILEGDTPKSKKPGYKGRDADENPVYEVQPGQPWSSQPAHLQEK